MHPLIVNRLIFPLQEWVKRKPTLAFLRELEKTQWLSARELHELQLRHLRAHLEFAYREVPYYRDLFHAHAIQPAKIFTLAEFSLIPHLTKEMLRARFAELQPKTNIAGAQKMSTGGSTGTPVTVLVDRERAAFTDAARLRAHRWYDADIGAREIALWGSPIELGRQDSLRNFRDWLMNSRLLSAFDLGAGNLAAYAEFMHRYRPEKMYGYASTFYLLARYLQSANRRPSPGLKVIFATAEPLFDFQRKLIEDVFGCAVAGEYGARDAGLMANECPKGGLHIPAEGMLVEIDQPGPDGLGEIVITNLYSKAMPIIRYRTGDMGELDPAPCQCGRGLPRLKRVEGRRTDFLVAPSGRVIHALAIIYVLREIASVKEFQVIQEELDRVLIRVVPENSFSDEDQKIVVQRAQLALGREVRITLERTPEIPRLPSGKFRYVISNVADAYLDNLASRKVQSA